MKDEFEDFLKRIDNDINSDNYYGGFTRDIKLKSKIIEELNSLEYSARVKYFKMALSFFKVDWDLGNEIMSLAESNDVINHDIAYNMLFGSMKESIKNEILKEIRNEYTITNK